MIYDPYTHAETLGIEVIHRPISKMNGLWIPDHNVIVIRSGMKVAYDVSTLAHELGHAKYGHRDGRPKHEHQADKFASDSLIDVDEAAELMQWVPDCERMALELGVTARLLRVWMGSHPELV